MKLSNGKKWLCKSLDSYLDNSELNIYKIRSWKRKTSKSQAMVKVPIGAMYGGDFFIKANVTTFFGDIFFIW